MTYVPLLSRWHVETFNWDIMAAQVTLLGTNPKDHHRSYVYIKVLQVVEIQAVIVQLHRRHFQTIRDKTLKTKLKATVWDPKLT